MTCEHNWQIWPETDGQDQRCSKCHQFRSTPAEDKFWLDPIQNNCKYGYVLPDRCRYMRHLGCDCGAYPPIKDPVWLFKSGTKS